MHSGMWIRGLAQGDTLPRGWLSMFPMASKVAHWSLNPCDKREA